MAAKPSRRKDESESAINDVGLTYSSNPKTHFFYEYEEECAVDPLRLTEDGIFLWHEQMLNISERDISHLWRFASELLGNRHDASVYSHVEWLRYEITLGVIVPENWDRRRPYPYKWMLVSAIYFQEARRLCEEGSVDRVWHITAMAYYHLGMNTNPSLTQSVSRAATSRHAKANMKLRALVHAILDVVRDKGLARNIKQAKEKIIEFVRKDDAGMDILEEFNASTPKGARHNKDNSNIDRLENLLDDWAGYNSPYPEIRDAFLYFKNGGTKERVSTNKVTDENIPAEMLPEDIDGYVRIISYVKRTGGVLTVEISRDADETMSA